MDVPSLYHNLRKNVKGNIFNALYYIKTRSNPTKVNAKQQWFLNPSPIIDIDGVDAQVYPHIINGLFNEPELKEHLSDLNTRYDVTNIPLSSYKGLFGKDEDSRKKELAVSVIFRYLKNHSEIEPVCIYQLRDMLIKDNQLIDELVENEGLKVDKRLSREIITDFVANSNLTVYDTILPDYANWINIIAEFDDYSPVDIILQCNELGSDGQLNVMPVSSSITVINKSVPKSMPQDNLADDSADISEHPFKAYFVPTEELLSAVSEYHQKNQ